MLFQEKRKKGKGKAEAFISNSSFRIPLCIHNCAKINIIKYCILGTFYKYKKQLKQLLWTKIPTKIKKGGYLVLYYLSIIFQHSDDMLLSGLYTHSSLTSVMEISRNTL